MAAERVDIGFVGGQVMTAKLDGDTLKDLRAALDRGAEGWHDLKSEDGQIAVDLAKVAYVRVDAGVHQVGFISEG
jgi:hypothetical protein